MLRNASLSRAVSPVNPPRFRTLLLEALREFAERGYVSEAELQDWLLRLHAALDREMPTDSEIRRQISAALETIFKRDVNRGGVQKRVPGIDRYTIDRVYPELRAALDRRILAGVELIKLHKKEATEKTLRRFSGWITSMPAGGKARKGADIRAAAKEIIKPSAQLKFERRRVAIDQGHKLSSTVAHVVAVGSGAIAGIWHDRGQFDRGYDARPEHLARSGKLYLMRDSWALSEGLIKKSGIRYMDEIEQPAFLPFCSCWWQYIIHPQSLPPELLTAKGRAWLEWGGTVRHDSAPSPAQIEAGNYRKGHARVADLDITIETPENALRIGVGADGEPWSVVMPADYGYIRRTTGADDEQIDCYLGPHPPEENLVYLISQHDLDTNAFDEHKVMLGFKNEAEALSIYELGFSDGMGRARIGWVQAMSLDEFKSWLSVAA